ncbi:hypothetical protein [Paenibacillus lautus]|uniref:hypothetical protein n=1 Tax=Paenibacillus lautus TaxID=1401 RepID=UPI001FE70733|nr:hypothetical protein [Paenibacillus lautus]
MEKDRLARLFASLDFTVLNTDKVTRFQIVAVFAVGCDDKTIPNNRWENVPCVLVNGAWSFTYYLIKSTIG